MLTQGVTGVYLDVSAYRWQPHEITKYMREASRISRAGSNEQISCEPPK